MWQGGGVPPRRVEMRTKRTRQGGRYPPYRAQMKRTRRGGARQNESNDTRRRGHAPPHRFEMQRTRRGGGMHPPPCHVKKETWTQQGGPAPSPSCWNGKNATRRSISLLAASKRKWEHDREGTSPPRRVEVARTRRGGCTPPHRVKKETKKRPLPVMLKW